ncbi:uncharacterized protein LOC135106417 isoform X2 [Scylla paramamosain]|uniref:uncharacterized protein LOC135106417 isoform X2 n=1 Tax=Scylla paramamosain TaxID=85552 RepID=UPI0030839114
MDAAGIDRQSTVYGVRVRNGKKPRGRPRKNLEPAKNITEITVSNEEVKIDRKKTKNIESNENINEISINMQQLRRSTRERKTYFVYGEDSLYEFDEDNNSFTFPAVKRNQKKAKAQRSTVNTFKSEKSMQKQDSKKQSHIENQRFDEKLKETVIVRLERLEEKKTSSMEGNQKGAEKQVTNSERDITQNIKNISKKIGKKGTPVEIIGNKKKTQSEAVQNAEDLKITAKKGTLKYLQQREKYIECLAKEAQKDDDFSSDNAFFTMKKYKFTNLLPPSHEDTLNIMTPKREKNENRPDAVITPRTALLGQLQPFTPNTQPYSPFPTLDKDTRKDALKQVYQVMKGKKHQPIRKPLQNTVGRNRSCHLFTPLES